MTPLDTVGATPGLGAQQRSDPQEKALHERHGHGLVIGKFYPPHAGHHLLIDTAARACARVTVVVMAATHEGISLQQRLDVLRAVHSRSERAHHGASAAAVEIVGVTDDYPVDYDSDQVWDSHVGLIRAALGRATVLAGRHPAAAAVDAVFSSEDYGQELARRLGARHLLVDLERRIAPVSGTAVRADLIHGWEYLAGPTKALLARRVVVLGAESTGTSTLAADLAEALRARGGSFACTGLVGEYGRDYTWGRLAAAAALADRARQPRPGIDGLVWTAEDFVAIATRQLALEDAAAAAGSPVLVCDTDAFATGVWFTRYLGGRSRAVETIGEARDHHLYLLTDHEGVPFVQDGIRDGEHLRTWMTEEFDARLRTTGRRFLRLAGTREQRLAAALAAVDALLAEGPQLPDPLG